MDIYNKHFINNVIELVMKWEKNIAPTKEKDLIIFIGKTQDGKTTAINSLLGVHFEEQDDDTLAAVPPESLRAAVGCKEEGGVSCTEWPTVYFSDTLNMCFLDTKGFLDVRCNREANIASSILMNMAINQAKCVKIVCMNKYSSIKDGMSDFHQIGKEISQIIGNADAPVFFLFNRFQPSKALLKKNFYGLTEEQQNTIIREDLKKCYERIEKGSESVLKAVWKRVFNRAKDMGIISNDLNEDLNTDNTNEITSNKEFANVLDQDPEIQQINHKMIYSTILKNSFDNNYYGYLDPTSEFSIQNFVRDLSHLPSECLGLNYQYKFILKICKKYIIN